jgi:uncharacterized protein (TIGR03067 family)
MKIMKKRILGALLVGTLCTTSFLPVSAADAEPGFKSLFNGHDLSGWAGRPQHWSVQDGAITGTTTKEMPAQGNNFLIAKDGFNNLIVGDFELRCSFKFSGDWGNSGIQYRSEVLPNFVVHGYQADMETGPNYTGMLYEEGGRGILAHRGQKVVIKDDPANPGKPKIEVVGSLGDPKKMGDAIDPRKWNNYVIIAKGNHLQHFINGVQTVDVIDEQTSKAAKSGVLAFQLHAGQPMKIQFKNIRIKFLSGPHASDADLTHMQGDWRVVEFVMNGQKATPDMMAGAKLKIKANEYFFDSDSGSSHGTLKLGGGGSPKSMDVITDDGSELPAIYDISGDTLKVCYATDGASRPKEFKSSVDSDTVFATYKRKAE